MNKTLILQIFLVIVILSGSSWLGYDLYTSRPPTITNTGSVEQSDEASDSIGIEIDIEKWLIADMDGWSVKYPPSPPCRNSISYPVCLNENHQHTFAFMDWHYGTAEEEGITICGETFEECVSMLVDSYYEANIDYERERVVNGIKGVEVEGILDYLDIRERIFFFEREGFYGISAIHQREFSPELDDIYERILTTIEFVE